MFTIDNFNINSSIHLSQELTPPLKEPERDINVGILHCGSKGQYKGDSRNDDLQDSCIAYTKYRILRTIYHIPHTISYTPSTTLGIQVAQPR